jgi:ribosome-binding protein aMBF1 (putative translation factor)
MDELERIAYHAPRAWRSEQALKRTGFKPVAGGLREAVAASRLLRLVRQMAHARRRAGLSQAQVARRMGTTASAVSRMESDSPGNLTLDTVERYAHAVGAELSLSIRPVRQ